MQRSQKGAGCNANAFTGLDRQRAPRFAGAIAIKVTQLKHRIHLRRRSGYDSNFDTGGDIGGAQPLAKEDVGCGQRAADAEAVGSLASILGDELPESYGIAHSSIPKSFTDGDGTALQAEYHS